jgi:hypothetical protein
MSDFGEVCPCCALKDVEIRRLEKELDKVAHELEEKDRIMISLISQWRAAK